MRIDIVIDTVCPWCYVGKRRLEEGLALRPDQTFEVVYHPFLLAPDMPRAGKDRKQHYEEKFGKDADLSKMRSALMEQSEDIDFRFEEITRVPNTIDSHRLIRWAQGQGRQAETAEGVLKAYFTDAKDIGDMATLVEIARAAGLDASAAETYLSNDEDRQVILQLAAHASGMGITGVPFYIFDGTVALTGAQPAQVIADAVDKALQQSAA